MIGSDVAIRPTTPADVLEFNEVPSAKTIRAFSIFWHGELAAITGITIEQSRIVFFSDIKEEIDPPKITVWRVSKYVVERVKKLGVPVIAGAKNTNSEKYLKRLGFFFIGEEQGIKFYRLNP